MLSSAQGCSACRGRERCGALPAFEGRDLGCCTQQTLHRRYKRQSSSLSSGRRPGPFAGSFPRAATSGTRCPSRPSRPPVPASPSQPWVPPPSARESPLATAVRPAFSGLADWPNSGRRRCRHFRHPEAAKEAERRPSWVREARRCRERGCRQATGRRLRRKSSRREKSSQAQAPLPQSPPWSAPAARGDLSRTPHPLLQGPPAALCGGSGAEIRGATGGGGGGGEGVRASGAP
ncbi:hypothetical protein AB1E18_015885 [Capra hircus]